MSINPLELICNVHLQGKYLILKIMHVLFHEVGVDNFTGGGMALRKLRSYFKTYKLQFPDNSRSMLY